MVLSGYDVQTMSIRDILYYGDLPNTGTSGSLIVSGDVRQDGPVTAPVDLDNPEATSALATRCPSTAASYPDYPMIPQSTLDGFKTKLQYSQTFDRDHFDCDETYYNIGDWFENRTTADTTWMYITADVVYTCNKMFPDAAAPNPYWQDAAGNTSASDLGPQAMFQNVLMGDVFWVNDAARFSEADNAVHIEADKDLYLAQNRMGAITFYDRYSNGADYREPLPTAWAFRYIGNGSSAMDTYIRAWKGSTDQAKIADLTVSLSSGYMDAWDCLAYTYYAWDEDEGVIEGPSVDPWSGSETTLIQPNLLPLETQEVMVDQFNLPDVNGWMLFVWPTSNISGEVDHYQTWMGVKYAAYGTYSAFMEGAVLANANCFYDQVLPVLNINYDYVSE